MIRILEKTMKKDFLIAFTTSWENLFDNIFARRKYKDIALHIMTYLLIDKVLMIEYNKNCQKEDVSWTPSFCSDWIF